MSKSLFIECLNQVHSFANLFFDLQHVELASLADFRYVAAFLPLGQEAGIRDDNLHGACTWYFRAKA